MKNNNAFTLVELLAVITILGILALLIVPNVSNYIFDTKMQTYASHETTMEKAAESLTIETLNGKTDFALPLVDKSTKVLLEELEEMEFIKELVDPGGSACDKKKSFVTIKNNNGTYEYSVCLHCGKYVTDRSDCS